MARKKPKPKPNRHTVALNLNVRPEVRQALDGYLATQKPAPTITACVEVAIEEFLTKRGWPPPADPAD